MNYYRKHFKYDPSFSFLNLGKKYELPRLNLKRPEDIIITAKPIEISSLESFRVKIDLPKDYILDYIFEWHPDNEIYFREKDPICACDTTILMRHGCQCGGV